MGGSENEKNTVRAARKIQRDGGLVHDSPMPIKYKLPGFTGKASLAQADAAPKADAAPAKEPAAPVEEKKEGEQKPPKQNPKMPIKRKLAPVKQLKKLLPNNKPGKQEVI